MATMTRTVLTGRAGSPGIGVGWPLAIDGLVEAGAAHTPADDAGRGRSPDVAAEQDRLRAALDAAAAELEALAATTTASAGDEVGAIFEAQALFARDPGIVDPTLQRIAEGRDAASAILEVTDGQADALAAVDDEYFRERAADVRDVGRRIAAIVRGDARPDLWHADGRAAVLVGTDLDPSAVAGLRRELVAGIALGGGAPTGHAAIVARALGIPLVLGLGPALDELDPTAEVAVDGTAGRLVVHPVAADRVAAGPLTTVGIDDALDLHGVRIVANVASATEAEAAAGAGADGIGLVRTELLFLGRSRPPSVAEQRTTYARIVSAMAGRPVVFRTLDVGGDKPAAWQSGPPEANPALGVRGVRLGQREPALLDDQLRALVEAAGDGPLRVMLPMIATREELDDVRARLDAIVAAVAADGGSRPTVELGVMIEIPAAAIMADRLAEAADFFSIGTNDLVQYTLAADRTSPELADLASALQPSVLRLIDGVVRAADPRGRHVAVCGEAAGDPAVIPFLVGLGIRELSVTPSAIPAVRAAVAALDPEACRRQAAAALAAGTLGEVRSLLG
jgi:phosphoenolpyruvate-protein phosphotransferase